MKTRKRTVSPPRNLQPQGHLAPPPLLIQQAGRLYSVEPTGQMTAPPKRALGPWNATAKLEIPAAATLACGSGSFPPTHHRVRRAIQARSSINETKRHKNLRRAAHLREHLLNRDRALDQTIRCSKRGLDVEPIRLQEPMTRLRQPIRAGARHPCCATAGRKIHQIHA